MTRVFQQVPSDAAGRAMAYLAPNRTGDTFHLYADGFFDAGHQLAKSMLRSEGKVDLNVYPLVYLYRHGVELALKQLAMSFGEIFRGDPESELEGLKGNERHSIKKLWNRVKPNIESAIDLAGPDPEFPGDVPVQEVDEILEELHQYDPGGVVFRYPTSIKGDPHLADVEYINIHVFHQAMLRMTEALSAWLHRIGEEADHHWHERVVEPWLEARDKSGS